MEKLTITEEMNNVITTIEFPEPTGIKCNMMPFIQGDSNSLPEWCKPYKTLIDNTYIEHGEIGHLTIDEAFVDAGESQRGYNSKGLERNVHVEVGRTQSLNHWGGPPTPLWGGRFNVTLDNDTKVLIANNVSGTCRYWDTIETAYTEDGDLSDYIERYPIETGVLLRAGELLKMSIFTPHECVQQVKSCYRQFIRIVGKGVKGREDYFTVNPLINSL
jgi:hypothetical protein